MQATEIVVGSDYALREPARPGVEFQHVRVLEKVRTRWKVERVEPNPGLVEYVKSANIVVLWKDRVRFLRDEQRLDALTRVSEKTWDGHEGPMSTAVDLVLESTGERLATGTAGILDYASDVLARVSQRAGINCPEHPAGYRDRFGISRLPFECAQELATAFARAEPQTVLTNVDLQERRYELEVREPGASYLVALVNEYRAAWALVRQWAGHDKAVALREGEIDRLRQLLGRTMWDLRRPEADAERIAARLERGLKGQ